jgi:hypothetical protein
MTTSTQVSVVTNRKMTSDMFFWLLSLPENDLQKQHSEYAQYWQTNESLVFNHIEFENSIEFNHGFSCIYEMNFVSCKFKSFHAISAAFQAEITFENCEINIFKVESNVSFLNQLNIGSKSQINTFQLSGGHYEDVVCLDDSTIKKNFLIKGSCVFEESVSLTENIFETHVKIWGGHFKKYLVLSQSEFKGDLSFQSVILEKHTTFFSEKFEGTELRFEGGTFSDISISGGSYDSIIFSGGDFEYINIFGSFKKIEKVIIDLDRDININYLEIDFTESNCKMYKFQSLIHTIRKGQNGTGIIKDLCLKGVISKDVYCEFVNFSTPEKIDCDNLTNFGNIYFKDIRPLPNYIIKDTNVFRLFNTDLGKTTFMGSDFSNLYLDFQSSKITESFISDSILPKEPLRTHLATLTKEEKISLLNQQRSAFSQIKKIYENRGDTVTALEYYAKEMDILNNNPATKFSEWINLKLSELSTIHGTDWSRGLLSTLIASTILFFLFCLSVNIYPSLTCTGWSYFWDIIFPNYFEFLNPLHKSKEIVSNLRQLKEHESITISGLTSITDFMSKIIITYCQFQLVQAFRKHGKK